MGAVRDMREDLDIPMPSMGPASYRVPRRPGMDPNTRRLAMIAGGIGGALLLLIGGWEIAGHRHHGVPTIEADQGPVKVKPENPGGMKVAGQNDDILSGASDDGKAQMAPPPETPDPKALKAAEQKPAAPRALGTPPSPPSAVASAPPAAIAEAPAPQSKPAPARPAATAKATPAPAGRGAAVQLAALASEEQARAEWERLEHKMPSLLGGRKPEVSRIEHDGKTFWRLRTGGFASAADATSFCEKIKAKGAGCAVAVF